MHRLIVVLLVPHSSSSVAQSRGATAIDRLPCSGTCNL